MERDQFERTLLREILERHREATHMGHSRKEESFVARSIQRCESHARSGEKLAPDQVRDPREARSPSKEDVGEQGHGKNEALTPYDQWDRREDRICHLTATIVNERTIQRLFLGRGWANLQTVDKLELFRLCEKMCAELEHRDRATILAKYDREMWPRRSHFQASANEIWLNEERLLGPRVPKLTAVRQLFREQAHAYQRQMVQFLDSDKRRSISDAQDRWPELPEQQIRAIIDDFRTGNRLPDPFDNQGCLLYHWRPTQFHANGLAGDRIHRVSMYLEGSE